ncbi:hypothetical protein [Fervidobacterium sp. 2310opik-2]|uniref:hypothetical protein n=1 Tax=Fervidobacterium sp. 2310opik-2 TaxID=1755815 RepID=UPI0013E08C3A|nr:hypothetical protein [Fervidobacterium sp. 2310opik-2]KAF2961313.1 hypothetical protein AS161_01850 [Fervidobacterium sp. 2310opik-2]
MVISMQDIYLTDNAEDKLRRLRLEEKDVYLIIRYGKRSKARRSGFIHYVPKKLIEKNRTFEKYKDIFIIEREGRVIDIFKNSKFRVLR